MECVSDPTDRERERATHRNGDQASDGGGGEPVVRSRDEAIGEPAVFEYANHERIGVAVVDAVSTVAGVDPLQLDTRLYDVIDPDALERTIRNGNADVEISFRFEAYRVSVFGDGGITVTGPAGADRS
ncbi:HalOD1 output domain-containing protein [Halorubrum sp. DTA98]|uniref:HalOD1 output domain-containing protein n=1 Tax=Halorubrum sp. DTA98 TaxID=3402163 RepID=UPI003AAE8EDD